MQRSMARDSAIRSPLEKSHWYHRATACGPRFDFFVAVPYLISALILFSSPCLAGSSDGLVGDCNDDDSVTVNELVLCSSIALGREETEACDSADANEDGVVSIDELVEAVGHLLGDPVPPTPTVTPGTAATATRTVSTKPVELLSGTCRRPAANGLVSCDTGTVVSAFRCENRANCTRASDGRAFVADDDVDGSGFFSIPVPPLNGQNAIFVLQTEIDAIVVRTISIGGLGAFAVSQGNGRIAQGVSSGLTIDPISEASVRILDGTQPPPSSSETVAGLALFQVEGVEEVIGQVREANDDTDFRGQSAAGAIDVALDSADTPQFQLEVVRQSLNTFIRTDRGCQETGQSPVYTNDDPIEITYRVDDLFDGESVGQAAARIVFALGIPLLDDTVPTDDTMQLGLVIAGVPPFVNSDVTLLLTAEANGVEVSTGCRIYVSGN